MNITNIKQKLRKLAYIYLALPLAGGVGGCLLTSCDDFLDTLPLNDVVLENYWTKKDDVTSVLNSCYESLASNESVMRMAVWGEMRSDNIIQKATPGFDIQNILKEDLLPTNSMANWSVMYTTIKNCNTVIHYAPGVEAIDPNYEETEMEANIAEATFIRDLCYFYLFRTFRSVPMSFEASIDDQQNYVIPPTSFEAGLDSLILDLKKVETKAVRRYYDDTKIDNSSITLIPEAKKNSSRITRYAIYALLADLNLWRGNYEEVVKYCDLIIDYKKQQYKDRIDELGNNSFKDMALFNEIPLILERPIGGTTEGNAYNEIFGKGNSCESIFEICFTEGGDNKFVHEYYNQTSNTRGYLGVPATYTEGVQAGNNTLFTKDDCRAYESIMASSGTSSIGKYVTSSISFDLPRISGGNAAWPSGATRNSQDANWIIYRLTDVMLMKAEALIEMGSANYDEAFKLINAVYRRAHSITSETGGLNSANYNSNSSYSQMITLLFDERNRELMFEGKRWYDLVRKSLRDGNTLTLRTAASKKNKINENAVKIKLADPNIIFFPYSKEELKLNSFLKQNPAYGNTEDFIK